MRKVTFFEIGSANSGLHVYFRLTIAELLYGVIICLLLGTLLGFGIFYGKFQNSQGEIEISEIPIPKSSPLSDPVDSELLATRREFIRNLARESWTALTAQAHNSPNSFWLDDDGSTTLQSLSSLWLMDLTEEYKEGRDWVEASFEFSKIPTGVYLFHVATEYLGPLLSCYAQTGDTMFLEKALNIGEHLKSSIVDGGLPFTHIFPQANVSDGREHPLAQLTGQHLELYYLSHLSNSSHHLSSLDRIRQILSTTHRRADGLYLSQLNDAGWTSQTSTLFWPSSFFYSTLLQVYLQSNQTDSQSLQLYIDAIDAIEQSGMIGKSKSGLIYVRDYDTSTHTTGNVMKFDGCHLGAMFALGGKILEAKLEAVDNLTQKIQEQNRVDQHWQWAKGLTETCHWIANQTRAGFVPWKVFFDGDKVTHTKNGYLSSDLPESYFYLYRLTGNAIYREYAWEYAQSIERSGRTTDGHYRYLLNVDEAVQRDSQHSGRAKHFIGATLKYLYLTFAENTDLPLEKWVFNAFGAPLPICGHNDAFGKC